MKLSHGILPVCIVVLLSFPIFAVANEITGKSPELSGETITFGVVPQQSAQVLAKKWTPLMQYLSRKTGINIHFATAKDIPTFEQRVGQGEYDLVYMNPYHYTVFSEQPGYRPLVKQRGKRIKGILVVHKDSPIQHVEELDGQTIAFPSPAAFAASIIPRSQLIQQGVSITPQYVSSHDSVYRTVANHFFPAGGGIVRTFNNTPPAIRDQLRILWTSPGFTPHAIALHPRFSKEQEAILQQVLIGLDQSAYGKSLLSDLNISAFEAAVDEDWDDVRGLNIKLLDGYLQ